MSGGPSLTSAELPTALRDTLDELFGDGEGSVFCSIVEDPAVPLPLKVYYLEKAVSEDCATFLNSLDALWGSQFNIILELVRLLKRINDVCFNNEVRAETGGVEPALRGFQALYSSDEGMPGRIQRYLRDKILQNIIKLGIAPESLPLKAYGCEWRGSLKLPVSQVLSSSAEVLKTYFDDPLRQEYFFGLARNVRGISEGDSLTAAQCAVVVETLRVLLSERIQTRRSMVVLYAIASFSLLLRQEEGKRVVLHHSQLLIQEIAALFDFWSQFLSDALIVNTISTALALLEQMVSEASIESAFDVRTLGAAVKTFVTAMPRIASQEIGAASRIRVCKILGWIAVRMDHWDKTFQDNIAAGITLCFSAIFSQGGLKPEEVPLVAGTLFLLGGTNPLWLARREVFDVLEDLLRDPVSWFISPYAIEPAIKALAMFFEVASPALFQPAKIAKALTVALTLYLGRLPFLNEVDWARKNDVELSILSICCSIALRLRQPEVLLQQDEAVMIRFLQAFHRRRPSPEFASRDLTAVAAAGRALGAIFNIACAVGDRVVVEQCIDTMNVHHSDEKKRNAAHYLVMRRGKEGSGLLLDLYQRYYGQLPSEEQIKHCFVGRQKIAALLLAKGVSFDVENETERSALDLVKIQSARAQAPGEERDFEQFKRLEEAVIGAGPSLYATPHYIASVAAAAEDARQQSVKGRFDLD